MSIANCPKCRHATAKIAIHCPRCGTKLRRFSLRRYVLVSTIALATLVCGAAGWLTNSARATSARAELERTNLEGQAASLKETATRAERIATATKQHLTVMEMSWQTERNQLLERATLAEAARDTIKKQPPIRSRLDELIDSVPVATTPQPTPTQQASESSALNSALGRAERAEVEVQRLKGALHVGQSTGEIRAIVKCCG